MLGFVTEPPFRCLNTEAPGLIGILLTPAAPWRRLTHVYRRWRARLPLQPRALPGGIGAAERDRYPRAASA